MSLLASHPIFSRNLVIATVTSFFNTVGNGLWAALLPLYYRQLGASDTAIGFAFSLMLLAHTFLQFAGGLLADRVGRRNLLFAMTLNGPLFIVAGLTSDWRIVLLAIAGTRTLMGTQWPALFALVSESVPKAMQGKAFSIFEFAIGLGATVGPLLGALLIERFGVPIGTLIIVHGIIVGCTSLLRWLFMQEGARNTPPSVGQLRAALTRDVWWFTASKSLLVLVETMTLAGPFFALFTHDVWRASEAEINLLTSVGSFFSVIIGLWGGHWTDRVGGRRVIMLGSLVLAATLLGWVLSPNLFWGFVPLMLLFISLQTLFVAQQAQMALMTTPQTRASMVGLIGTAQNLTASTGPSIGAALVPLFGAASPFGFALLVSLLCAWTMSRVKHHEQPTMHSQP